MPDSHPQSWLAQARVPAIATIVTLLVGALFSQASGIFTLPARVDKIEVSGEADRADRETRRQENAARQADIERRVRTVEDDNRDQGAAIGGLQSGQTAVTTKLDDFIRDQRDRLDKQQATLIRIETVLENIKGASAPSLPSDPTPRNRR